MLLFEAHNSAHLRFVTGKGQAYVKHFFGELRLYPPHKLLYPSSFYVLMTFGVGMEIRNYFSCEALVLLLPRSHRDSYVNIETQDFEVERVDWYGCTGPSSTSMFPDPFLGSCVGARLVFGCLGGEQDNSVHLCILGGMLM
jgi:hypothetical protein